MSLPTDDLRRSAYLLLATVAVGIAVAKVVGVENVVEPSRYPPPKEGIAGDRYDSTPQGTRDWPAVRPAPTPMFGSNDRSRWATVRALVENGTYEIGRRENHTAATGYTDTGIVFEDGYTGIDRVMNPATGQFFSSKPPLLTTMIAGEYWVLNRVFGYELVRDRWVVVCVILLTVNVLPFVVYLVLLTRLIEDYGTTDFGRLFTFAAAGLGTFLTTFTPTLNNHSPATYCVLFAVYPLLRKSGAPDSAGKLAASGFFAGLSTALELPAAALLGGLFVPLLIARPGRTLACFLPAAFVPLCGLLVTNYLAIGELMPAYDKFDTPWYRYPGSHWSRLGTPGARGIDFIDEPKGVYAFHLLFGHHGWFSLTPVFVFGAVGLIGLSRRARPLIRRDPPGPVWTLPHLAALTLAISGVVYLFYVFKTNNYGGNTAGPRWLFWLTPLWLVGGLPAVDRAAGSARGRWLAALALGVSVLSVYYPAWNPWRPPWLQQAMEFRGLIRY
jgi:hypothetical protein